MARLRDLPCIALSRRSWAKNKTTYQFLPNCQESTLRTLTDTTVRTLTDTTNQKLSIMNIASRFSRRMRKQSAKKTMKRRMPEALEDRRLLTLVAIVPGVPYFDYDSTRTIT